MQQVDISKFLYYVEKPGRYSNNELNCKTKRISDRTVNFVLAFPDLYEVGMSHLGLKILYTILNREQNFAADRVYAPAQDFAKILQKNHIPLCSIEDKIPLHQFDVIGFTLQYELSYTNILLMLDLAGIPVFAEKRGEGAPLVIAGGPGAFNPEPLSVFFDAFVIGDGEEIILELANCIWENRKAAKNDKLRNLAKLKGVYVPKFYEQVEDENGCYIMPSTSEVKAKVEKNIFTDFDNPEKLHSPHLVPLIEIIHNRPSIEIMRGCSRSCRFCQAGMTYRPVRERDDALVQRMAGKEIQTSGWEEVSLGSLSSSDYTAIESLILNLSKEFSKTHLSISLPSLRIDTFTKKVATGITKIMGNSLTFAPEAGSQRLRNIINKQIMEEDILNSIKSATAIGLRAVKLYFMIGLPFEDDDDISAIVDLIEKIFNLNPRKSLRINVSISSFVPKPFTPFQWAAQQKREILLEKIHFIKRRFKNYSKIRIKYHSIEQSILEAVIARGDRKIGKLIYGAYIDGAKFDTWDEFFDFSVWEKSAEKNNIDLEKYTGPREMNKDLCWDHIDCGIHKDFLKNEYKKAKNEKTTSDCRNEKCQNCGICEKTTSKYLPDKLRSADNFSDRYTNRQRKIKAKELSPNFKFRIYYEKSNELKFCSHRDLLKLIYKVVRRSGLPVYFTKGFSPHPKVSFGPPLSLGLTGENEFFDINLQDKVRELEISKKLNHNIPQGFHLKKVEFLYSPLQKIANYQYEKISVNSSENFDWAKGISSYHKEEFLIEKKGREVDLKEIIEKISLQKNGILLYKKISGANIFDILENLFQFSMNEIHKLSIKRIEILRKDYYEK